LPRSGYTLQPRALALGYATREIRLKVAAESLLLRFSRVILSARPASGATFRAPSSAPDPGLKPWAILCSRFAARFAVPSRDRPRFWELPGSKLPGYDHSVPPGQSPAAKPPTVSFLARMLLIDTCHAPTEVFLPCGHAGAAPPPCRDQPGLVDPAVYRAGCHQLCR
jgi:hypothetical protein